MAEAFFQTLDNLRANKLRSLLTMFGILALNVFLELRDRGLFKKKAEAPTPQKPS